MWSKSQKFMKNFILYSFRRWPYAIRARLALSYLDIRFEHREVNLKNRPKELYNISSKGTVPVLQIDDDHIIDESLDIMIWANKNLKENKLLTINPNKQLTIIKENDTEFKFWLDRYKYFDRFPENSKRYYFNKSSIFLKKIEDNLNNTTNIIDDKMQLVDYAVFPFIRQFANVDFDFFKTKFKNISDWYLKISESKRFKKIMNKYEFWSSSDKPIYIDFYI